MNAQENIARSVRNECDSTAKRMPAVHCEMKRLEEEIALLGSVADDILVRIHQVLRPEGPTQASSDKPVNGNGCDLAIYIASRTESLSVLRLRMASVLERIEL